jgi:glyoxalase family protein
MGWRAAESEGEVQRFLIGDGTQPGSRVDVRSAPDLQRGGMGPGIVHHVAWRVADDAAQAFWLAKVQALGGNVSPVMERNYFRSIYFREPGGVLFEIATDTPGFTSDESAAELGTHLKLPGNLEASRTEIERIVPPLRLPGGGLLP